MQKTVKDVNDRINALNLEKHSFLLASINHYQPEFDSKIKEIEKRIIDLESIPILDIENKLFFDMMKPMEIKQETIENIAQKCVRAATKIAIVFDYINYKCIKSRRLVIPITSYMGSNEYHPLTTLLMLGYDLDKCDLRIYDMLNMSNMKMYNDQ